MQKKIVIAGGTGFVGKYCVPKFRVLGYRVIVISRSGSARDDAEDVIGWDDRSAIIDAVDGAEMVINLAGKSVDCRYSEKNKAEILSSRVDTTKAVGEAIFLCNNPPPLWLNASTATIYRDARDRPMTESDGEIDVNDFSAGVARQWEEALFELDLPATRRVALRIAIALGNGSGVLPPSKMLVRFGLGGKQGRGDQMFSWVHIEDLYRMMLFVQEHEEIEGPLNAVAPNPVTNEAFMRILREKMHRKFGMPAATWMLKIGGVIIRTEPELLLKSRWVMPEKLMQAGFEFKFPLLDVALEDLLASRE